jgi:hypothetical protein
MSNDLYTQLSEYGSQTREAREPVSATDVANRVDQVQVIAAVQAPNGRRGWHVAVAAAAGTLLIVGSVTWLAPFGGSAPSADEPTVTTIFDETTLLEGVWERTVIEPLGPAVHFEELQATSFGVVAAAVMDGVWISADGSEWHQALAVPYEPSDLPPEIPTPPLTVPPPAGLVETYVRLVAEYDGVLYAAGSMATGINTPEMEIQLLIWRSEDGQTWEDIILDSSVAGYSVHPTVMVAGEDALLVFMEDAAIYRSEDGKAWTRFGPGDTGLTVAPTAVGVLGGEYVAIGETAVGQTDIASVFTSPDGVSWVQVPDSEFPEGHYPYGPLVEYEGALYVGGLTFLDDAAGAVWRSTDGRMWTPVDLGIRAPYGSSGDEELPAMYAVNDLITTPHGLLVIGVNPGEAVDEGDVVLLATTDGLDYELVIDRAGIFSQAEESAGTWFNGQVVMVGYEYPPGTETAPSYQWMWTP